jgi:hypothetical protein
MEQEMLVEFHQVTKAQSFTKKIRINFLNLRVFVARIVS